MANGFIGQVNIGSDQYLIGSTLFATSDTASNEGAKVATLQSSAGYSATTGATIHVKFDHGNTVTTGSSLTLKVGSDSARPIVNPNGALSWNDNSVISFTCDGTNWVINSSGIDASSTSLTLGNISSSGTLTNNPLATIATGDYLVITDASDNSGRIAKANLSFDTTKTDYFLSQAGSWTQINKTSLGLNNVTNHQQVHEVAWDSTNKKITRSKNGTASDVVQFIQGDNITLTGETGKLTIAGTANDAVTQTNTTGNVTYSLLFSYSATTTDTKTEGVRKHSTLTYNPSTGILTATKFSGNGSGLTNVTASSVALADVTGADDLKAIEALTGTSGLLKKTAANTWTLDTTSYATSAEVNGLLAAADAMTFKGTIGAGGTINTTNNETLPDTHAAGDAYKVITADTYAGQVCEVGDLIICIKDVTDSANASDSDWTVAQTNIDGAVTGPASSTANHIAVFNDTSGKIIKDSGITITPAATGFTISGGTTSKTLTVDKDITLGTAAGKSYTDSSSASAISTGTSLVTERDVYYGLPQINHTHNYTSSSDFYAPTSGGTAGQYLKAGGENTAPTWETFGPGTVGLDNVSNNANLNKVTGAKGDIIYWSDTNTPAHLVAGTNGYVLTLDSGVPKWKANQATDENVKQSPLAYNGTDANKEYAVLFKNTHSAWTQETAGVKFTSTDDYRITINPSTGTLTAKNLVGALRATDVKTALSYDSTTANSSLLFLHKSGDWKTLQITNESVTIASVSNGVLTLTASVNANATLGIAT